MITLFFDIETIPCAEEYKNTYLEILKKKNGNSNKAETEIHANTSFDGTFGRICSIAVIKEMNGKEIFRETFSGDEKEILINFWKASQDVMRFVGHNIWSFDLPFIYQRSIINKVKPRTDISFARYRDIPIYDTMLQWSLWNFDKVQKLDTLAKVLGLPTSKDEMDGSMVWDYYQQGRIEEINKYCMKDVELTRQVYKRMIFEGIDDQQASNDIPF